MIVTTSTRASKESKEELCIFFPFFLKWNAYLKINYT